VQFLDFVGCVIRSGMGVSQGGAVEECTIYHCLLPVPLGLFVCISFVCMVFTRLELLIANGG